MHDLLRLLFGWHRYRLRFNYKDRMGRIVFSYTRTVGVANRKTIDDHRALKVELGPVYGIAGVSKRHLTNGTIDVEPMCYLGRWK